MLSQEHGDLLGSGPMVLNRVSLLMVLELVVCTHYGLTQYVQPQALDATHPVETTDSTHDRFGAPIVFPNRWWCLTR